MQIMKYLNIVIMIKLRTYNIANKNRGYYMSAQWRGSELPDVEIEIPTPWASMPLVIRFWRYRTVVTIGIIAAAVIVIIVV